MRAGNREISASGSGIAGRSDSFGRAISAEQASKNQGDDHCFACYLHARTIASIPSFTQEKTAVAHL